MHRIAFGNNAICPILHHVNTQLVFLLSTNRWDSVFCGFCVLLSAFLFPKNMLRKAIIFKSYNKNNPKFWKY
jgi:hypothetical protein